MLYGNTRYTKELAGGIFTLKIADLVAQDATTYKCIVTDSSPASAESTMTLIVIGRCSHCHKTITDFLEFELDNDVHVLHAIMLFKPILLNILL